MSAIQDTADVHPERAPRSVNAFYWSVRRELWQYPWLWIAPVAVAGIALVGDAFDLSNLGLRVRYTTAGGSPEGLQSPFALVAITCMLTAIVVASLYCLSAIHGERRDRSLVFWRSLPVSDTTAVLAKTAIPLLVLPGIVAATVLAAHLLLLIAVVAVALATGLDLGATLSGLAIPHLWWVWLNVLVTGVLLYAPIFAWLLLVSAWARRAALLWAVTPGVLCVLDRAVFGDWRLGRLWLDHFVWQPGRAQAFSEAHQAAVAPLSFAAAPGLWPGLIAAALFVSAAIWLRRRKNPL